VDIPRKVARQEKELIDKLSAINKGDPREEIFNGAKDVI